MPSPDGSTSTSTAAPPRRPRSPRRSSSAAPTSASPSTATPIDCVAVDATGRVVDGDQLIGLLALDRLARGALDGGGLVVSVLSNGGLQGVIEAAGGQLIRTPVGDKYILEGMQVSGAVLGGEKSGHVIIREHSTSGDGVVTALEVLRVIATRGRPIAELAAEIPLLPQQQRAVPARHRDQWEGDPVLQRRPGPGRHATGRDRPDPRPTVRHRARPAGDGRGSGRRAGRCSWPTRSRPSRGSV